MTTELRRLLEDAKEKIDTYKHPDIDDFKVEMSKVLEAAGVGSMMRERVERIDELSWYDSKYIEIGTSWSARGCEQTGEYRIPSFIIDSVEPLKVAHKWKIENALAEAERELALAQEQVVLYAAKVVELTAQLKASA